MMPRPITLAHFSITSAHMTRHLLLTMALLSLSFTACGPPIAGLTSSECGVAKGSACLCPDGIYYALVCAPDGSLYCACGQLNTRASVTQDMSPSPDMHAPDMMPELDMMQPDAADMPPVVEDAPADLNQEDMCSDGSCAPPRNCEEVLRDEALPASWKARSIGYRDEDLPPKYGFERGRLCMRAAGNDIWDTSDRVFDVSFPQDDHFDLSAKFTQLTGPEDYTKTGIMFRESDAHDAPFVFLQLSQNKGVNMLARDEAGNQAAATANQLAPSAPIWLRMIRQGSVFYGYTSTDGNTWKPLSAFDTSTMPESGTLGVLLASNDPTTYAEATVEEIVLDDSPDTTLPCPGNIACDEVNTYRGIDVASKGGLDMAKFRGPDVIELTVTRAGGQSVGTLHSALLTANQRAKEGLYTIIEVDLPDMSVPIQVRSSGSPRAANVWIRGHGAIIESTSGDRNELLKLDDRVILEGFHFRTSSSALVMDRENIGDDASPVRHTGIWIHHNSFDDCSGPCIRLAPTEVNRPRHVTISHNNFGTQSIDDIDAIDASNQCSAPNSPCEFKEGHLYMSIHHNYFDEGVQSGYPTGGAQIFYYNNVVYELADTGLDLNATSNFLSRRNLYRTATGAGSIDVFPRIATVNNETDIFERAATRRASDRVPDILYPDYFTYYYLSRDHLVSTLVDETGPVLP